MSSLGSIDPCVSYFVVFHVFVAYSKTDYNDFTFHKSTDDAYICMEEATKHCYETTDLSHGIAATSVRLSGRWRRGLIVTACGAPGQRLWQVSPLLYTPRVGLASVH